MSLPNTCTESLSIDKHLVLVECGSFNPIHVMHIRMLERARDLLIEQGYTVDAAVLSPVSGKYGKKGLADVQDRLEMCRCAVGDDDSTWIVVDDWEAHVCI